MSEKTYYKYDDEDRRTRNKVYELFNILEMIRRRGIGRGRIEVTSKERAQMRRRRTRRHLIVIFILILAIFGAIVGLFHLKYARIQSVKIAGTETLPEDSIQSLIKNNLAGAYFFLIPRDSVFFYPKQKIEQDVIDAYPQVQTFSISLSNLTTLSGTLSERHQVGVWCKEGGADCYFVDEGGFLYERAPQISGNVYFTYSGDLSSGTSTAALRGSFLDPASFAKLNAFLKTLKDQNLFTPISFTKTAKDEGDLATSEGVVLRINVTTDSSVILANLASALGGTSLQDPKVRSRLEYIDLRFENKMYYKLKGGSTVVGN